MTYREMMIGTEETIEWCEALSFLAGKVIVAMTNGGAVESIQIDGKDVICSQDNITRAAKLANECYDLYSGRSDAFILLDADHEKLPCCECPWFDVCTAMDEEC